MNTKRQRLAELRRIIERVSDADLSTTGITDILRERIRIEVVVDAAKTMQSVLPRKCKGQVKR
jgi:hypothetical protein